MSSARSLRLLTLAIALHVLTAAATAADTPVPENIRELMQDRKYAEAVKAIDAAAAKGKDQPSDYMVYLKGRALHLQEQYDAAIETYDSLEKKFPKSSWLRRARFAKAVSLARKGDFRAAELVYRDEVTYLLSADRKQEIAELYLEFADAYFKPKDENQPPDYAKALEFYRKALEVGPKPDKRAEIELLVARSLQLLGNHQEAANHYAQFIKDRAGSELEIEARFRLGEAQMALGQPAEARRTWQDLLAVHADVKSDRVPEAAFNLSLTYGIPAPANDEDLNLGVASLESFIKNYPAHALAAPAYLRIAQSYVHRGRYADAVKTLDRLLADERYKDREELADARNLLGLSYQRQKKFDEALTAWRDYLVKHPSHHAWSDVQREIINTEYLLGAEERAAKRYEAARKLWTEFMVKYPLDPRNPGILLEFGQMSYEQKKWDEAIADWRRLVSKYPGTEEASRGQYMVAFTLETQLGKLEDALKEYKKVTWGGHAAHAQGAVGRLTTKSLTIATERVFRTNERPKIKLVSRNIESVTVRAFKVDLETYFRKMHLVSGVEGLDIALIDPDKSFEFKIPKYAEYQQLENYVEIPLPQTKGEAPPAGVMAVTISSPTLEATTLVVQSDLDIVVKSSRDELLVFTQNMLTGKAWPKVKLLVSNGQQVFAEAATGDDGVFKQSYKELKDAGDVRVFAITEGSIASNIVSLQGVGVAQGLADQGYIYTDRPAYRAGQIVHVRGVLRRAIDDNYSVEAGKPYTVEIFDVRNRSLWQEQVKLSPFGSFHLHFMLPTASPAGQYRILARDDDGRSHQGAFTVQEYRLEPVRLAVETERKVFYRGEEIEGKITARFYYGAPVVGQEVRYQLAGGKTVSAKTDAQGEVHFKLPTREFRESQVLPLVVTLPQRNLQLIQNFFLATQGFSLSLSTVRPVFMAGETFELSVKAVDAEGKPIAEKLTLHVLEQTTVEGKVGERPVEQHELATDAAEGTARKTLQLAKGGQYVLRIEGIDRFKNPITAQHSVQVSDENDAVRLRILADRHTYKVGDSAEVQLHWREEPALALITFQGAKILDYKLVQLVTGPNKLAIPMTARLAPNFELSVAVMTDARGPEGTAIEVKKDEEGANKESRKAGKEEKGEEAAAEKKVEAEKKEETEQPERPIVRFHEADSQFTVERALQVAIKHVRKGDAKGPVRPGEEVEVTVTTTDPQGKPVSAELSLAMIEQSLLAMFQPNVGPIGAFFRGQAREPAVRTTSSIMFAYRPDTRPINPQLLAEKERLEIAEDEAARQWHIVQGGAGGAGGGISAGTVLQLDSDAPSDESLAAGEEMLKRSGAQPVAGFGMPAARTPGQAGERQEAEQLGLRFYDTDGELNGINGPAAVDVFSADGTTVTEGQVNSWHALGRPAKKPQDTRGVMAFDGRFKAGDDGAYFVPDADNLNRSWGEGRRNVLLLFSDGSQRNLALGDLSDAEFDDKAEKLGKQLVDAGVVMLPQFDRQETGYWNPAIVTDEKGTATLTITVPEISTAWKLLAKGVTTDTLAGEAESELAVSKDVFGELRLPLAFTDGDDAEVLVSVHNNVLDKGKVSVVLKTTIGGKSTEEKRDVELTGKGIQELTFKAPIRLAAEKDAKPGDEGTATFELSLTAGDAKDLVRRVVPVRPYGMPVFATAGGTASSDATVWVEAPKDMPLGSPRLQVIIGPTVEQSLLDVLLAPPIGCQAEYLQAASALDTTTSDLMAGIALQKLLGTTREAGGPQAAAIDDRIRSALSLLVASQQEDGGWSWTGQGQASHAFTSARAVWAMSLAKAAGYKVPDESFGKAKTYLQSQVATTAEADYESKAILLHALAAAGSGDFTLANRLYRNRQALSTAALVHLVLAFAEMDRKATAEELLRMVAARNLDEPAAAQITLRSLPWSYSPVELRALYALALERVGGDAKVTQEVIDWLMAHRSGHRWVPEKATGPATLAVADWFAKTRFKGEHYKLVLFVNDLEVKTLDIGDEQGTQVIDVPARMLKEGKQRVNLLITGRGRFSFQAVLAGFVAADKLKSTTGGWGVRRFYEPAPLELDGEEIPRGFGVLQSNYEIFRNALTQLPVGKRGRVELQIWRIVPPNTPEQQLPYLVVTEPLASGTTVIENSINGGFERYEIGAASITFYIGSRRSIDTIRYDVHGYLPGQYRAAPTVIRNAYRLDQLAVSEPKALAVLPLGAESADPYKLTPQELYELGKRYFAKRELKTAGTHLAELIKLNVNPDVYKDAARMLLDLHLETGPPAEIVRYFEIIKERWPDLELPFEKIIKVAAAYHEIGEYERSYLVFRATVESSFLRESAVAGFLESQGEFMRSVDFMKRLLAEYPPEPYVAAATYALAQRVYSKAPQAAADPKLREKKITRVDLVQQAVLMLDDFLTAYPEDPAADQAAFSLANALLELKAFQQVIASATKFALRYAGSDYLDSYWYIIAYGHFALGEHEEALKMARKVAEAKRIDKKTGREVESLNKWQAIYILGQVYHSLGKAAQAIVEYARVEDRFADAKQAIAYFTRQEIALPEVTTIKPKEPAAVELKFRNVATVDVKVYRIDLMKFSLLKRNLGGITQINLAGIQPQFDAAVELGDGKDYRDRTHKLELPLEEEGAYLVVARGGDLHASGLVLISPLVVDVQEEAAEGRVRVTVRNILEDAYVADVHVKVIGSRNGDFISGQTDLRGVFVADGVQGMSTVIAQAENSRYAFFRGTTEVGPRPDLANEPAQQSAASDEAKPQAGEDLLENLFKGNNEIQVEQKLHLEQLYQQDKKGVQAQDAF